VKIEVKRKLIIFGRSKTVLQGKPEKLKFCLKNPINMCPTSKHHKSTKAEILGLA
jgi:hypothetical protein